MYIRSFGVKNFMLHRDTRLNLFPVTVVVGSNNGGKSALFDALLNFSMVSRGRLSQAFGPGPFSFGANKYHGASPAARISFDVALAENGESDEHLRYHISYAQRGGEEGEYVIFDETLEGGASGNVLFTRSDPDAYKMGNTSAFLTDDRSIFAAIRRAQVAGEYEETDPLVTLCAREISRISKFRLDPTNLARPSKTPDVLTDEESRAPRLDYRGEDLPGVLYYLAETEDPALENIEKVLREVLNGFETFEFNTVGTDRIGFSVRFSDARGIVPAANLSDGTLSLIGMMALLLHPERPSVLCLEEPENGLTPRTTRAVYEAIRGVALDPEVSKRAQIIVSSHSPFVICEAWNGEDRDFIYHMKAENGQALTRTFAEVIERHEIHLEKDKEGKRTHLGLKVADLVLEGYWS